MTICSQIKFLYVFFTNITTNHTLNCVWSLSRQIRIPEKKNCQIYPYTQDQIFKSALMHSLYVEFNIMLV